MTTILLNNTYKSIFCTLALLFSITASQTLSAATLSAGGYHTCLIKHDGTLACWGITEDGRATPPSGTFSQVSVGWDHACALRTDGTLICWGRKGSDQPAPLAGNFSQVSAGGNYTCVLRTDGIPTCWGDNYDGQATPPAGTFTQISTGWYHACGIKTDKTVVCWGRNDYQQATPPEGTFSQMTANGYHACGIKTDGTVVCWGNTSSNKAIRPPSGIFTQIAAGFQYTCGIKTDSTLVCWGNNDYGQTLFPLGSFMQVSAGYQHACGVKSDGTVTCWGDNSEGQAAPPFEVTLNCTYHLEPASYFHAAAASKGTVTVTASAAECPWTVSSQVDWVTMMSGNGGRGNGMVSYLVSDNTGYKTMVSPGIPSETKSRSGTLTIAGQTITVTQEGTIPNCTYTITPTTATHSTHEETDVITISTPASCPWTATSNADWITITSGGSGQGNGTVTYSVADNTGLKMMMSPGFIPKTKTRSGTLTIAGQTVVINQEGNGFLKVSDGAEIYYDLESTVDAISAVLLIHGDEYTNDGKLEGSDYLGNPFFQSFVDIKFDIRGFGQSTLVGEHPLKSWAWGDSEHRVTTDVVELLSYLKTHEGWGPQMFQKVNVVGFCIGSAVAAQFAVFHPELVNKLILVSPWLEHTLPRSNPSQLDKLKAISDKTLLLGGADDPQYLKELEWAREQGYTPKAEIINNAGHSCKLEPRQFWELAFNFLCQYTITPTTFFHSANAETGTINITAPAGCPWTATSNAAWVTITSEKSGKGRGAWGSNTVTYSVADNTNAGCISPCYPSQSRSGTISIAGQTVTITQNATQVQAVGIITTVAGNGESSFYGGVSGDGEAAINTGLSPKSITIDGNGNLYIAEGSRIRKVDTAGIITTVAGNGKNGFSGDGGPATSAQLNDPKSVIIDSIGNLYIADFSNNRIRKVDTAGIITTVAGNGVKGFSGDGGAATNAQLSSFVGVAITLDSSGNLYITDNGNHRIRKVDAAGIISTVAGNGESGFSGDGGVAANAQFDLLSGIAVDSGGNLYIADIGYDRIRKIDTAGIISTVAGNGIEDYGGDGGPATNAQLKGPRGIAVDSKGNLYIVDSGNNRIRKIDTTGIIFTVAGNGVTNPVQESVSPATGGREPSFSGDGGPAISAQLDNPIDVAVDSNGNLYIADTGNNRIRKVTFGNSTQPKVEVANPIVSQAIYQTGDTLRVTLPSLPAGQEQYVGIASPDGSINLLKQLGASIPFDKVTFPVWSGGEVAIDKPVTADQPSGLYTVYLLRMPTGVSPSSVKMEDWALGSAVFSINHIACTYMVTPANISHSAKSETGTVTVNAPAGCPWTATSNTQWITITSENSGQGNGTVTYSVKSNFSECVSPSCLPSQSRSGTLTIAGQMVTVNQQGER